MGNAGTRYLTATVAALLIAVSARADPFPGLDTGNALQRVCAAEDGLEFGACIGYINGSVDQFFAIAPFLGDGMTACRPRGVTYGQAKAVILKHLNDHPERLQQKASALIAQALIAAFPCEKKVPH
jgi:hypothetical protein